MSNKNKECEFCSYNWISRVDNPLSCPRCKRRFDYKESKGFIKKAFKLGFLGAATVGSTLLGLATAGISAPLIGGALAAGGIAGGIKKGKKFYDVVKKAMIDYSAVNVVLNPMIKLGEATYPA